MSKGVDFAGWLAVAAGGGFEVYASRKTEVNYTVGFYPYANYTDALGSNGWGAASNRSALSVASPMETMGSAFNLSVSWASTGRVVFEVYDASSSNVAYSSEGVFGNTTIRSLPPGRYYLIFEDAGGVSVSVFYHTSYTYLSAAPSLFPPTALGVSAYPPSPGFPSAGVAGVAYVSNLSANTTPYAYYYGPGGRNATIMLLTSIAAEVSGVNEWFTAVAYVTVDTANGSTYVGDLLVNDTGAGSIFASGVAGAGRVYSVSSYIYPPPPPYEVYAYNTSAGVLPESFTAELIIYITVNPGTGFAVHFGYDAWGKSVAFFDNATVVTPGLEAAAVGGFGSQMYSPYPAPSYERGEAGRGATLLGSEFTVAPGAPELHLSGYGVSDVWNTSVYRVNNFTAFAKLVLLYLGAHGWEEFPEVYAYAADTPASIASVPEGVSGGALVVGVGAQPDSGGFTQTAQMPLLPPVSATYNTTESPPPTTANVYVVFGSGGFSVHLSVGFIPLVIFGAFGAFFAFASVAYFARRRRVAAEEDEAAAGGAQQAQVITVSEALPSGATRQEEAKRTDEKDPLEEEYTEAISRIEKLYSSLLGVYEEIGKKYGVNF